MKLIVGLVGVRGTRSGVGEGRKEVGGIRGMITITQKEG